MTLGKFTKSINYYVEYFEVQIHKYVFNNYFLFLILIEFFFPIISKNNNFFGNKIQLFIEYFIVTLLQN